MVLSICSSFQVSQPKISKPEPPKPISLSLPQSITGTGGGGAYQADRVLFYNDTNG